MLSPHTRELLSQLATSAHGRALKEYLDEKYETINDVTSCQNWEHTVGKQIALGVLKEIFSFLEEKKAVDKLPNQYT
jgi:hypothetical protein